MSGHKCKLHSRHIQPTGYRVLKTLRACYWNLKIGYSTEVESVWKTILSSLGPRSAGTADHPISTLLFSAWDQSWIVMIIFTRVHAIQLDILLSNFLCNILSVSRMRTCISSFHPPNMSKPDPRTYYIIHGMYEHVNTESKCCYCWVTKP